MILSTTDLDALKSLSDEKFLITGGNGMLGSAFEAQIKNFLPQVKIFSIDKDEFDLLDGQSLTPFLSYRPTTIIHCAALVDADYCENFPDIAHQSIVQGTENIVEFAERCSARIFYPQSFLIFDEPNKTIDELTPPNATHVYAKKKIAAESIVLNSSAKNLSIRMAGFFGGFHRDTNFVGMIVRHLAKLLNNNTKSIEIGNRVWQPTYTYDLAVNSLLLLAHQKTGVYNFSSYGSASFFELTNEIVLNLGINDKILINEVCADLIGKNEPAKRPRSAIMSNSRAISEGLCRQRHWKISLSEYLNHPFFKDLFRE